jgi:hypothetical protein
MTSASLYDGSAWTPSLLREHGDTTPCIAETYRWRPPHRVLVRRVYYPSLDEAEHEMLAQYDATNCRALSFGGAGHHEWWIWQCPPTAETPWPERYIVRFRPAAPRDEEPGD